MWRNTFSELINSSENKHFKHIIGDTEIVSCYPQGGREVGPRSTGGVDL